MDKSSIKMRRLVIGDIHGGYRAMMQVLERAEFDEKEDMLIGLGDYADGWPEVNKVIEYLRNLPNFEGILGNHDDWLLNWLKRKDTPYIWTSQGGMASIQSYQNTPKSYQKAHSEFLSLRPYYTILDRKLFIHGGPVATRYGIDISRQTESDMMWSRELFMTVAHSILQSKNAEINISPFEEVYIGHTTTQRLRDDFHPVIFQNIFMLDQGGGWNGKLTVMDIDTKDYWQSDFVPSLYPEEEGRG